MTSLFKSLLWISLLLGGSTLLHAENEEKLEIEKKITLELKAVHPQNDKLAADIHAGKLLAPAGWTKYMLPILDDDKKKIGEEPILLSLLNVITRSSLSRDFFIEGLGGSKEVEEVVRALNAPLKK